jgi:thiamine pyrophosphokinase
VTLQGSEIRTTVGGVIFVVSGGGPPNQAGRTDLPPADHVIAADGGVALAHALGLDVDEVIGDLDSASETDLARVRESGGQIHAHPAVKDATDLELALAAAAVRRPARIILLGSDGGRLDHLLGCVLLLGASSWAGIDATSIQVEAELGLAKVTVVRGRTELHGTRGELVSLLPVAGGVHGITTEGLLYPLRHEALTPGTSRGMSNEFVETRATVSVAEGALLAVQPGAIGSHLLNGIGPAVR